MKNLEDNFNQLIFCVGRVMDPDREEEKAIKRILGWTFCEETGDKHLLLWLRGVGIRHFLGEF